MRKIYRNMRVAVILTLLTCLVAHAQQRTITGTVKDETGSVIPGANIIIKGTSQGTTTDADGLFSLQASNTDILAISFIGYKSLEMPVGEQTKIDVALENDLTTLGEVVVVGYGEQKRSSLTAAVSVVDAKEMSSKPASNLTNSFLGRVPGVMSRQGSGEPGQDFSTLTIRGVGTTGNSRPLLVVDGIYRDFSRLDPNSIESFSVLKDAAAVAPYGLAGANGVILVTTKRGKLGIPTLSYNAWTGVQNPTRVTPQVNSYEYALMKNEASANENIAPSYTEEQVEGYRKTVVGAADADPDRYPNSSPLKDIIDRNTTISYQNIELSGGSEKIKYYMGLGHMSQEGMYKSVNLRRYNMIAKVDADATKTTKVSLNLNSYNYDVNYPAHSAGDLFYQAFRTPPVSPVYYSNGLWGQYVGRSLIGQMYHSGNNKIESTQITTTFTIEQKLPFLKGLSVKGVASFDPRFDHSKRWQTPIPVYTVDTSVEPYNYVLGYQGIPKPSLTESYAIDKAFTYQGFINYNHTFGKHYVAFLGVLESRNIKGNWLSAGRQNFNTTIQELSTGSSIPVDINNGGSSYEQKQVGYVYRVSYNYKEKYLAEVAGRYDGHFAFAPETRFGFFPSFSLGWRLSEESFIRDNATWLDQAKLRMSYGESGNLPYIGGNLAAFQYLSLYQLNGSSAVFGGNPTQSVSERNQANPGITWERARKFDIGLETSLLGGLFRIEADYFYDKRSDLLLPPSTTVSQEYGIGLSQVNAGKMKNAGFEFSVTSNLHTSKDFKITLTGNFIYVKNKLLEVFETNAQKNNPNRSRTGRPLNYIFGYDALGLFQVEDDVNGDGIINTADGYNVTQFGTIRPGDIKYADIAGAPDADGNPSGPDGKIDLNDQIAIGPQDAQIQFGFIPRFQYKGFDLELLFAGAAKTHMRLFGSIAHPFDASASAHRLQFEDHWTPENRDAAYARLTGAPTTNNAQDSDWWVRSNSYIRLRTFEIGYTLPMETTKKVKIQYVRFFLSGQNLFTWTPKMKEILDPEAASANGQYYFQQQVLSAGGTVTF